MHGVIKKFTGLYKNARGYARLRLGQFRESEKEGERERKRRKVSEKGQPENS